MKKLFLLFLTLIYQNIFGDLKIRNLTNDWVHVVFDGALSEKHTLSPGTIIVLDKLFVENKRKLAVYELDLTDGDLFFVYDEKISWHIIKDVTEIKIIREDNLLRLSFYKDGVEINIEEKKLKCTPPGGLDLNEDYKDS